MADREWGFDKTSQRYKILSGPGAGQFIGRDAIANLTEKHIERTTTEILALTETMLAKKISVSTWEYNIADRLKDGHIAALELGRGGVNRLNPSDYGWIGQRIRGEYGYLRGFSEDILSGNLSQAQIRARIRLYTENLYATTETGRRRSHAADGFRWEKNIRTASESCTECIEISALGWQPIGTSKAIGNRICLTQDRCYWEFSRAEEPPADSMRLGQSFGWVGSLRLAAISKP